MPGSARPCSTGSPIRLTLSKQVRSRTVFAGPCGRNAKSDPWRPLFHSASASPYGLRSSRTELYPLNLQRPKVGQIKRPKWAKPTCQKQTAWVLPPSVEYLGLTSPLESEYTLPASITLSGWNTRLSLYIGSSGKLSHVNSTLWVLRKAGVFP